MYCLIVKYNSDGLFIGEDLGEIGKNWRIWDLEGKIYKDELPILTKKLESKLEKLIEENPRKKYYELKDRDFYGGTIKVYLLEKLENPIKEGDEKEVADLLINYLKNAPGGI